MTDTFFPAFGSFLSWLLAVTLLFCTPTQAQSVAEPTAEIMTALRALGVSETKARTLAQAMQKADEEGVVTPLVPFLADPDHPVAFSSALLMIEVDAEEGARAIRTQIGNGKANTPALTMSLSSIYDQENVDFLIARISREGSKEEKSTVEFSLRVVTGQAHSGTEAWATWWKGSRETFEFSEPEDLEEQSARMRTAMTVLQAGRLRDVVAGAAERYGNDKAVGALSNVAGMIESAAEATRRGQALRLNEQAAAADELFSGGKLEAAEQMYLVAVEADPKDERSRFLRACLLVEAGRYSEASAQFADIEKLNKDATASRFLRLLSERRQRLPAEPLLEAALEEFHQFKPAIEVGMLGWAEEPIIAVLTSQRLAHKGVASIASARLDELLARHGDEAEIAAGVALLRPRDTRAIHLQAAWERHPQSPLLMAALLQEKLRTRRQNRPEEVHALIEELANADAQNSLPRYLRIASQVQAVPQRTSGKERVKTPLSAATMTELAEAAALPRFDTGSNAATAAQYRALKELGHPFRSRAEEGRISFSSVIYQLAEPLQHTVDLAFTEGRTDAGKAACDVLGVLGARLTGTKGSIIDRVMGEGFTILSQTLLDKHSRGSEQVRPEKADRPVTETRKALSHISVFALLSLPIPSLENALVERILTDEVGFLQEQSSRKGKAAPSVP